MLGVGIDEIRIDGRQRRVVDAVDAVLVEGRRLRRREGAHAEAVAVLQRQMRADLQRMIQRQRRRRRQVTRAATAGAAAVGPARCTAIT